MYINDNEQSPEFWVHLATWFVFSVFTTEVFRYARGNLFGDIMLTVIVLFVSIIPFFITTQLLIPNFLFKKRYFMLVLSTVVMTLLTSLVLLVIVRLTVSLFYSEWSFFANPGVLIVNYNILSWHILICVFLSASIALFFNRQKIESDLSIASTQRDQAEINMLRGLYNPSFIMSVLETLQGNISEESEEVRSTVNSFKQMMKYQLHECNKDFIPLQNEVDYIKNYIDIQTSRLEKGVQVSLKTNGDLNSGHITPLLLLPLIENAFKYLSNHRESKNNIIDVTIERKDNNQLSVVIINSYEESNVNTEYVIKSGGIGLQNVQHRLRLMYDGMHALKVTKENGLHIVEMELFGIDRLSFNQNVL